MTKALKARLLFDWFGSMFFEEPIKYFSELFAERVSFKTLDILVKSHQLKCRFWW